MVDQYPEIGGAQTVFLQVMETLVSGGLEVSAAVPLGGPLEAEISSCFGPSVTCHGIPVPELTAGAKTPLDVVRLFRYTWSLLRLRSLVSGFDLIYVNGPRLFPLFLVLSSVSRARFVYHVHLDHTRAEKLLICALARHPRTHAVLVNSRFVLRRLELALRFLLPAGRVMLLENSLTSSLSRAEFVDRWTGTHTLKVVVIGRVLPDKGQDLVVDLAAEFPGLEFHILGDADFADREFPVHLKARAGTNVVFHGYVSDIQAEIERIGAQISLVPSRKKEAFGLAAIEGMACSCLTVTSGVGGLADIGRQTGAWTASRRQDWTRAVERIRTSPRSEMVAAAAKQHSATRDRYSSARFANELRRYLGI
jgi:glycosyltransferase involved in cell wall biosynthesis